MTDFVKAELAQKKKTGCIVQLLVVSIASVAGIILSVVNIFGGKLLYTLAYLLAGLLGLLYTAIKLNSTFARSVVLNDGKLYMRSWDNGFFPYNIAFRPKFFADFVPAKTIVREVNISDITDLAIGSRGFLQRSVDAQSVSEKMTELISYDKSLEKYLKRYDILYVRLADGKVGMMSVDCFDMKALGDIADYLERNVQGMRFKTNVRLLRKRGLTDELHLK